nr:hypothetical transcript [Hymenolepis microstoma]
MIIQGQSQHRIDDQHERQHRIDDQHERRTSKVMSQPHDLPTMSVDRIAHVLETTGGKHIDIVEALVDMKKHENNFLEKMNVAQTYKNIPLL